MSTRGFSYELSNRVVEPMPLLEVRPFSNENGLVKTERMELGSFYLLVVGRSLISPHANHAAADEA